MITPKLTESTVEKSIIAPLQLGYTIKHRPEIAPGELAAERTDSGQVVLSDRLRNVLLRKLISGEIRVQAEKKAVEDAL